MIKLNDEDRSLLLEIAYNSDQRAALLKLMSLIEYTFQRRLLEVPSTSELEVIKLKHELTGASRALRDLSDYLVSLKQK